ncbi:MAG: AgmX/PglI C-terminal domain-containing protein [Deltaproteobacteria bacterium]|nr:AgmX/PglI C-terminal domain-containing protein [Deltaproteobacteria bacterium]
MSTTVKIVIVVLVLALVGALIFGLTRRPDETELNQARSEARDCRSEADELKEKNKQLRAALNQALQRPETIRLDDPELLRLVGRPQKQVAAGGGGDLSAAAVVKVVRQNRGAFQQCYERALKRNADLRGAQVRLNLGFSVGNNGVPRDVRIAPSVDENMTSCMAAAVRGWRFPPYGGEPVRVEIPVPLVPKE